MFLSAFAQNFAQALPATAVFLRWICMRLILLRSSCHWARPRDCYHVVSPSGSPAQRPHLRRRHTVGPPHLYRGAQVRLRITSIPNDFEGNALRRLSVSTPSYSPIHE